MSLEAKDALRLLEVLALLHFSKLSMKIFEYAWMKSQEVRKTHHNEGDSIDTLSPAFYLRKSMSGTSFGSKRRAMYLGPFF